MTVVTDDWQAHALSILRAAGHRSTHARRTLVEFLDGQSCALTAREIDDELRARDHAVGLASVYRNLDLLVELKLVGRLDVGQGTARYERLLPSGEHHHHLVCDRCGRVIPFDDGALERTIQGLSKRVNFAVAEHDVVLRGACERCRG